MPMSNCLAPVVAPASSDLAAVLLETARASATIALVSQQGGWPTTFANLVRAAVTDILSDGEPWAFTFVTDERAVYTGPVVSVDAATDEIVFIDDLRLRVDAIAHTYI